MYRLQCPQQWWIPQDVAMHGVVRCCLVWRRTGPWCGAQNWVTGSVRSRLRNVGRKTTHWISHPSEGRLKNVGTFKVVCLSGRGVRFTGIAQKATLAVQGWRVKHPGFDMHLTPTSASWLNMVERFLRDISKNHLRRGVFTSMPELVTGIDEYVAHHTTDPKPLICTQSARRMSFKPTTA